VVKTIRKSRAKENDAFADSAVIHVEHGAHLKIKSVKLFPPKFNEEDDSLWAANISVRILVVDDHSEDGAFDNLEFSDRFDLKMDLDVLEELDLEDQDLKNAEKSDFTKHQRAAILEEDNWTIRDNTKADKLNITLFGKKWNEGNMDFHEDLWVDKEFIAKVYPRTGKRPGSFCGWDTFVSANPPEKNKNKGIQKAQQEAKAAAQAANDAELDELPDLTKEEEKQMNESLN
jgi:hypothetical protein